MNSMRQISPVRGAFCVYCTVSDNLKSELELLYARIPGLLNAFIAALEH